MRIEMQKIMNDTGISPGYKDDEEEEEVEEEYADSNNVDEDKPYNSSSVVSQNASS
jgi:hypothetical protein